MNATATVWRYPCTILALWFVQPWVLRWTLQCHWYARAASAATAVALTILSSYVALAWHDALPMPPPRFLLALLWVPLGIQILRHIHLVAIGPEAFAHHFGLGRDNERKRSKGVNVDWQRRLCIFMWSPATVFFHPTIQKEPDKIKSRAVHEPWFHVLRVSLIDLGCMVLLCAAVLQFRLYDEQRMPYAGQLLLRILIMGTSVAFFRLLLEVPVRYALRHNASVRRILPLYNRPLLATCPRDFWHRWSTSVGYHLRGAFYDSLDKTNNFSKKHRPPSLFLLLLRASFPFVVNALFHIYWWSFAIRGHAEYAYIYLLGVYPLVSFLVQDVIMGKVSGSSSRHNQQVANKTKEWWQATLLRVVLWIGWASAAESMQVANGASLSLRDVCRSNLLLPKQVDS